MKITTTQGKITIEFSEEEGKTLEVVTEAGVIHPGEITGDLTNVSGELQSEANLEAAVDVTESLSSEETQDALEEISEELEDLYDDSTDPESDVSIFGEPDDDDDTLHEDSVTSVQAALELEAQAASRPVAVTQATVNSAHQDIAEELELEAAALALAAEARNANASSLTEEQRNLSNIAGELQALTTLRRI